jgi:hypothetical protein
MANDILEGVRSTCAQDETKGTRFAVPLGISNNLVYTSACTTVADQGWHQKDVTHQLQYVAREVERATNSSSRNITFSTLSGIMMNIVSRKDGVSGLYMRLLRRLLDVAHFFYDSKRIFQ